ncbi:MAG: pantetheine-phosphate adenylyltransferase [Muribaculaceae bacterium]|nr:pantetheine-phosphate adenylyltransferase [Muribaculaceae bacterium]
MTRRYKTALFAGSFDPFTAGHLRIVERALTVFDRVIVAVGRNIRKPCPEADMNERLKSIERAVSSLNFPGEEPRVTVTLYSGLTATFARETGADALLRGVRSVTDFEYERNLADVNLKLLGMDTYFLLAEPEYSFISSSVARELMANGHDISGIIP